MIKQLLMAVFILLPTSLLAQAMTVAGASSLRPTLDQLAEVYMAEHPGHLVTVIYGSSGRLLAQIINGAPFDIFMSADMEYPQQLADQGLAASAPKEYAHGRLALWSSSVDARTLSLQDLNSAQIKRIALAQPDLAPYGARAQQVLQDAGLWSALESKVVYGENIAQVAQMTASGAADVGFVAVSLAIQPGLSDHPFQEIDASMHSPLAQGFVVTKRGASNEVAVQFAEFLQSALANNILIMNGFAIHSGEHDHHEHD